MVSSHICLCILTIHLKIPLLPELINTRAGMFDEHLKQDTRLDGNGQKKSQGHESIYLFESDLAMPGRSQKGRLTHVLIIEGMFC